MLYARWKKPHPELLLYPETIQTLRPWVVPVRTFAKALEYAHIGAQVHHREMLVVLVRERPDLWEVRYLVCSLEHELVCRREGYKLLAAVRSYL